MAMTTDIVQVVNTLSYTGLFLWFVVYHLLFFVPFPPYELILLTIGYIASAGLINPFILVIIIVLSSLFVDNLLFFLSKKGNKSVQKIIHKYSKTSFMKYKSKLEEHFFKTYILLAFVPKVRTFGPVISGSLDVSWRKFLIVNATATTVACAFYVSLGYFFQQFIQTYLKGLALWEHTFFYVIMLIIAIIIFILVRKYVLIKNNLVEKPTK